MEEGHEFTLLDVRDRSEFDDRNIGGVQLPLAELDVRLDSVGPPEREIIVICETGARSGRAVVMLRQAGFHRVRNLTGGLQAWDKAFAGF